MASLEKTYDRFENTYVSIELYPLHLELGPICTLRTMYTSVILGYSRVSTLLTSLKPSRCQKFVGVQLSSYGLASIEEHYAREAESV